MSDHDEPDPAITGPGVQRRVWFLGALVTELLGGSSTDGRLAVLHHRAARGYNAPMHRHLRDDATFVVLDGTVELTISGVRQVAEAGSAVFVPRRVVHGFVVTSAVDDTPAVPDREARAAGAPAGPSGTSLAAPTIIANPLPDELVRLATAYGIQILGPPPRAG
jgi:quercetin dioxygenase-like cupin family protein